MNRIFSVKFEWRDASVGKFLRQVPSSIDRAKKGSTRS